MLSSLSKNVRSMGEQVGSVLNFIGLPVSSSLEFVRSIGKSSPLIEMDGEGVRRYVGGLG